MPRHIPPPDPVAVEQATIVYLQDWLALVLQLTRSLLLKYGISYAWLRTTEMQLVSLSHLMGGRSQLLSYLGELDIKLTQEMESSYSKHYITSWTQQAFDDPLCRDLGAWTDPDLYQW